MLGLIAPAFLTLVLVATVIIPFTYGSWYDSVRSNPNSGWVGIIVGVIFAVILVLLGIPHAIVRRRNDQAALESLRNDPEASEKFKSHTRLMINSALDHDVTPMFSSMELDELLPVVAVEEVPAD